MRHCCGASMEGGGLPGHGPAPWVCGHPWPPSSGTVGGSSSEGSIPGSWWIGQVPEGSPVLGETWRCPILPSPILIHPLPPGTCHGASSSSDRGHGTLRRERRPSSEAPPCDTVSSHRVALKNSHHPNHCSQGCSHCSALKGPQNATPRLHLPPLVSRPVAACPGTDRVPRTSLSRVTACPSSFPSLTPCPPAPPSALPAAAA